MNSAKALRVVIQQPSLAKYRVPVYRALAAEPGVDLTVVYGEDPGIPNVEPDGFAARFEPHRHIRVLGRTVFEWSGAQLKYADASRADVLVMVWNTRWLSLPLALRKARRNGVRTVVWGHGYSKNEAPWRATLRRRVANMADAVLFYSQSVADRYVAEGFPADKVFVAPNSLDQAPIQAAKQAWEADPTRLAAFRQEHGMTDQTENLLFVSRLDRANGLDLALRAVAELASSRPQIRLNLIGKGEEERARLESLAADLGIVDRVHFLGPIYGEDALAPWFLTAKVFVYPQNVGLSLLHAFGYGVPVVTSDDLESQNPEVEALEDGVNGRMYVRSQSHGLSASLSDLLIERGMLARMGTAAAATVHELYDVPRMVAGMMSAIVEPTLLDPAAAERL